jgi:hypothetical protein
MRETIGPVVKFLLGALCLIPAAFWLPLVIVCDAVGTAGAILFLPPAVTLLDSDSDGHVLLGYPRIADGILKVAGEFWDEGHEWFRNRINDVQHDKLLPGDVPAEIPAAWVFLGFISGVLGLSVFLPFWVILTGFRTLPFSLRFYIMAFKAWLDVFNDSYGATQKCVCLFPLILGGSLLPLVLAFIFVVAFFFGVICGLYTSIVAYESASVSTVLRYWLCVLRMYDRKTYRLSMDDWNTQTHPLPGNSVLFDCLPPSLEQSIFSAEALEFANDVAGILNE